MRAGKLDRVIRLQRLEEGEPDWSGHTPVAWKVYATLRAQILQASTDEFLRYDSITSAATIVFRTRFVEDVSTADLLVYDGIGHNIRELKEIGRRRGLEIRCVSTNDPAPEPEPDPEPEP